jgi:hypothetical protein
MDDRLRLLGIRHHGPGSAALVRAALDRLDPAVVLIEGAPEGDVLVPHAARSGMKPPVAMLFYAADDARAAVFAPLAEFSPEWQAMLWAASRQRPVRFIDWPAAVSLAAMKAAVDVPEQGPRPDPLDLLARAAGMDDGEAFWNALIEESGDAGDPLATFAAIAEAMTEVRAAAEADGQATPWRDVRREAFMRLNIRQALKDHDGTVVAVVGAWHVGALDRKVAIADDRAMIRDLPKVKVEATWAPWTDSRLAAASGYGAGVISPGWYRHLWAQHTGARSSDPSAFSARWQARTAALMRSEGHAASTASAIEAARLALSLAALRDLAMPGLAEMREAALAALCHGDEIALKVIERRLYIGETVGEIDDRVPQMPLARDLALWQRKTRLKPEDLETDIRLDLRSEAGLLKSTLLHRLNLINVPWGTLVEVDGGRGTFREEWRLSWRPEFAIALAEALVFGVTIEEAAGNTALDRAAHATSIGELACLVRAVLVADLESAATAAISRLQEVAVQASDITDLMTAVAPLVAILRYGAARKLPEPALRALVTALAVEVNAGARLGSHQLDEDAARARLAAMRAYDEALGLFGDDALEQTWRRQLALMVDDDQVAPPVAGLALRRLHDLRIWEEGTVAAAFSRHMDGRPPSLAGAFVESFLSGGAEIVLQDRSLLHLVDGWLCGLSEEAFVEALPLLRRSFASFDGQARSRLLAEIGRGGRDTAALAQVHGNADNPAFTRALPLLCRILGIEHVPQQRGPVLPTGHVQSERLQRDDDSQPASGAQT